MKVALAIRAAMLAVALVVMLAPIPYLAREATPGVGEHHEHLTFVDAIGAHGIARERTVVGWWAACAAGLAWAELARRRGRTTGLARAVRWIIVIAASAVVFTRPIGATEEHVDRLQGAGVIDLAALAYLIAMIAGTVAALAEDDA